MKLRTGAGGNARSQARAKFTAAQETEAGVEKPADVLVPIRRGEGKAEIKGLRTGNTRPPNTAAVCIVEEFIVLKARVIDDRFFNFLIYLCALCLYACRCRQCSKKQAECPDSLRCTTALFPAFSLRFYLVLRFLVSV